MSGPFGATPWMYDHTDFYPLDINQSLKFNDDESQYLSWTPATAGNRKTWTWSGWVKRGNIGTNQAIFSSGAASQASNRVAVFFLSSDVLWYRISIGGTDYTHQSNQVFRDVSAWYHIVIQCDTTQASSADRKKVYINGEQVTSWSSEQNPSQNADTSTNNTVTHGLGASSYSTGGFSDSFADLYMAEVNFIDGQALDSTNFGEFKEGIWIPKVYNGTYGSNGFHLPFKNDDIVEGFNTVTYRGNGVANTYMGGIGFSPDLIWIKQRSSGNVHYLTDSVRGALKGLSSSITDAESTYDSVRSFENDGFTMGTSATTNSSGGQYVAWAWDAGSGSPVSNTAGSITSTVKANPSYGFSIVNYTGTGNTSTIGHGLGVQPSMIITKTRNLAGTSWLIYHKSLGATQGILLNSTAAANAVVGYWNNTSPTSSVFTVYGGNDSNAAGYQTIAYCFAEVAGYSKISSYSGTGSAGNSITGLGFKPAFLMVKVASGSTGNWIIWDNTRDTNDADLDNPLFPNLSNDEWAGGTPYQIQFDADGFTINESSTQVNGSGASYIYMAFADTREAAFWKDVSGQGNHWQPNNLDYRDSLPDSTTNNFAVMNALEPSVGTSVTLSEGNLKTVGSTVSYSGGVTSSFEQDSGKWYWEVYVNSEVSAGSNYYSFIGAATGENNLVHKSNNSQLPSVVAGINGWSWEGDGTINLIGTGTKAVSSVTAPSAGDVLGFAIDLDNGDVYFYHNGTAQNSGSPVITGVSNLLHNPMVGVYDGSAVTFNFGQDSTFAGARPAGGNTDAKNIGDFAYAPPSGYLALCTANLPTPTIVDGLEHFNTVLYTGNGSTDHNITGVGFQPDFVWLKERSSTSFHQVLDAVRGAGIRLETNATGAETTPSPVGLSSFDADGFTVENNNGYNENSQTYVAWNWKAGGTPVTNTDGSITSQVSANVDAGFSIVSYTGTGSAGSTFGHGLNQAPNMVIFKNRDQTDSWFVIQDMVGSPTGGDYLSLNTTNAIANSSNVNTTLASSTVTLDVTHGYNASGENYIAYCFHSVEGFSKAGSYTGNGSADGPFVYTGFRPAFVLVKNSSAAQNWRMFDSAREPENTVLAALFPNLSNAETAAETGPDFLSNGFKVRTSSGTHNGSGNTIIYLAFAENPFKYANAR